MYVEGDTVYAILADYLLNSTGYAANAGLNTYSTYSVYSDTDRDTLLSGLTTSTYWNGLANGISGATVTGTPTAELLMKSYNTKNGTSLDYTTGPTFDSNNEDYDLYVPHSDFIDDCSGYWLASPYEDSSEDVWYVYCHDGYNCDVYLEPYGVRPVVALPTTTSVTKDGEIWIVAKQQGGTSGGTTGSTNIITAADVTTLDYGATVTNYTASNGVNVGWKIFHSDGENIYLIADDYVPVKDSEGNSYIPTGQGGTAVNTENVYNSSYNFYLENIATGTDYTGIADISTALRTEWLSQYTYTNETYNGKATAYLMDTDQWSGFANSYADYAIGGPTLELFAESYNKTHPDRTIDTQVIASPNDGTYGYQLKWSDEEYDTNAYEGFAIDGFNYTTESLYIIGSNEKAYGYWVASPSATLAGCVVAAEYGEDEGFAGLSGRDCSYCDIGARPLVSLKSSVQLEKQEDGSYLIVE